MKILVINYEFPPLGGGGGIASYDLAIEWAKQGQVDILTSNYKGLKKLEQVEGINIYRVPVLFRKSRDAATFISMLTYIPFAVIKGFLLIRKNRYHVLNTHFALPSGPVGYMLGKLLNIPNVLSIHGGDIYDPSKKLSPHRNALFKRVVKFILNRADRVVAQSSNTKDNAVTYYNPTQDVKIIPLAYHPPKITSKTSRKELNIDSKSFVCVTCGRLVKRKALDILIKGFANADIDQGQLFIMGDGPEREDLRSLAIELKVADRVHFLGYVGDDDKYAYLSNADLFTLPSMHEGFGIVYMEAMEMGLPILATNHGGQTDFLKNEENALLIDVGDIQACANSLKRFANNSSLRQKCARNNKVKIKNYYAEPVAQQYIELFKGL